MYSAEVATQILRRDLHDPNLRVVRSPSGYWAVAARRKYFENPTPHYGISWRPVREYWDIFHAVVDASGAALPLDGRLTEAVRKHHVDFTPRLQDYVQARKEAQQKQEEASHAEGVDRIQYDVQPRMKKWAEANT